MLYIIQFSLCKLPAIRIIQQASEIRSGLIQLMELDKQIAEASFQEIEIFLFFRVFICLHLLQFLRNKGIGPNILGIDQGIDIFNLPSGIVRPAQCLQIMKGIGILLQFGVNVAEHIGKFAKQISFCFVKIHPVPAIRNER